LKVGVITYHSVFNYGAMFQSWGMCQLLRRLGHEPEIIDYRPRVVSRKYLRMWVSKRSPISRPRQVLMMRRFIRHHLPLSQRSFSSRAGLAEWATRYPALLSGSDEIWNIAGIWSSHFLGGSGIDDVYFLGFGNPSQQRLLSYAASTGETANLGSHGPRIAELLKRYHVLSVREESGRKLLDDLGFQASVNVDPALMADYSEFEGKPPASGDYVLLFSDESDPLVSQINEVIAAAGLPAFCAGFHTHCNARQVIAISPGQMLGWIRHAKLICTSMFHGVVLALKYQKDFVYFPRPNKAAKARHLLALAGAEAREYPVAKENLWWSERDRRATAERVTRLQQESLSFLERALTG
jgi:hypothetical protein